MNRVFFNLDRFDSMKRIERLYSLVHGSQLYSTLDYELGLIVTYWRKTGQPPSVQYLRDRNVNVIEDRIEDPVRHFLILESEVVQGLMRERVLQFGQKDVLDRNEILTSLGPLLVEPERELTFLKGFNVKEEYEKRKERSVGLKFFVDILDEEVGGLSYGTVLVLAGFVAHLKTTTALNLLYSNAKYLGYNEAYLTLEVPKEELLFNLYSRHAFELDPSTKITAKRIKKALLTEEEEEFLIKEVKPSFEAISGEIVILSLADISDPRTGVITEESFEQTLKRVDEHVKLDAVYVDYINLLKYFRSARSSDQGVNSFISFFHDLCISFDGRSLIGILLAQINREGWQKAVRRGGRYSLNALAEFNQLEQCLEKGTLVPSDRGYIEIERLSKGCGLRGDDGDKIVNYGVSTGMLDCVQVTDYLGRSVVGSEKHRVAIWNGNKAEDKALKDIEVDDILISLVGYDLFPEENQFSLGEINKKVRAKRSHRKRVDLPVEVDDELAYALGYFLGDGCWQERYHSFLYNLDELDLMNRCHLLFESRFGFKYGRYEKRGCVTYRTGSTIMSDWLSEMGLGVNVCNSKIPWWVWKSKRSVVKSFVAGLWDAEGYCSKNSSTAIFIGMASKEVIQGLQELMLNLGVQTKFEVREGGKSYRKNEGYLIRIYGRDSIEQSRKIGLFRSEKKKGNLEARCNKIKMNSMTYDGSQSMLCEIRKMLKGVSKKRNGVNITKIGMYADSGIGMSSGLARDLVKFDYDFGEYNDIIQMMANNKIMFNKVVKKELIGKRECYDINVGGNSRYQAQGVLNHNSAYYVVTTFYDEQLRASGEVKMQLLKHRSGSIIEEPFTTVVMPEVFFVGDMEGYRESFTPDALEEVLL